MEWSSYQPTVVVLTGFNCPRPGEGRGLFRRIRWAPERGAGRGGGSRVGWDGDAGAAGGSAAHPRRRLQPLSSLRAEREEIYALWVQKKAPGGKEKREGERE